jgi:hypothetical protein
VSEVQRDWKRRGNKVMNGFKTLIFGSQFIVVGVFLGLRNDTPVFIIDRLNDFRLATILIVIGLIVSFFGLRRTD